MSGYGSPPPQGSYPPAQYGAPPPQQQYPPPGYGAPPTAPPPASQPSKMKAMLPAIIIVVGVVLAGVALASNWYQESGSYSYTYGTFSVSGSFTYVVNLFGTACGTVTTSTASTTACSSNSTGATNTHSVFTVTLIFVVLGLVLGVVAFVFGLLGAFSRRAPSKLMGMLPMLFALLAAVLMLLAPVYMMVALPGAIQADQKAAMSSSSGSTTIGGACPNSGPNTTFFGGCSTSQGSVSWGGSLGWYLAFGAFVLFLVGAVLFIRTRKSAETATAQPQWGQPAAGPQDPAVFHPDVSGGAYGGGAPPSTQPAAYPAQGYAQPAPAYPAAAPSYPAQPQGTRCPSCGYVTPAGYNVCGNCRARLY